MTRKILLLGGAGFVGSVLTPKLLHMGFEVVVFDLLIYSDLPPHLPRLKIVRGDIRDQVAIAKAAQGCSSVVHLAGLSIDGATQIPHELAHAINLDCFEPIVRTCIGAGVQRFIFASTCSIHGCSERDSVDEDAQPKPSTFYAEWKLTCEEILLSYAHRCQAVVLRAATACGPSPRQRFDLLINKMAAMAYFERSIRMGAPAATRPSVHIEDLADAYVTLLQANSAAVAGEVFHCAYESRTVRETALLVKEIMGADIEIESQPEDDPRSYCIDSSKIANVLGFQPQKLAGNAVAELKDLFERGCFADALTSPKYHNIKAEGLALLQGVIVQ